MTSNVPDDWGEFYFKCSECGGYYHASGSEPCDCFDREEEEEMNQEDIADRPLEEIRQAVESTGWADDVCNGPLVKRILDELISLQMSIGSVASRLPVGVSVCKNQIFQGDEPMTRSPVGERTYAITEAQRQFVVETLRTLIEHTRRMWGRELLPAASSKGDVGNLSLLASFDPHIAALDAAPEIPEQARLLTEEFNRRPSTEWKEEE